MRDTTKIPLPKAASTSAIRNTQACPERSPEPVEGRSRRDAIRIIQNEPNTGKNAHKPLYTKELHQGNENRAPSIDLNISAETLAVVREGMFAVVNEQGGTAHKEFIDSGLDGQDVKVYGKTGSTQGLENALFAGFAEDGTGRSIAVAVVVEGGQRGSADAGPLARDILQFCIEAGYVGKTETTTAD